MLPLKLRFRGLHLLENFVRQDCVSEYPLSAFGKRTWCRQRAPWIRIQGSLDARKLSLTLILGVHVSGVRPGQGIIPPSTGNNKYPCGNDGVMFGAGFLLYGHTPLHVFDKN
ncbi:hypothetical protein TNCV_914791 [Trichonephila clavipes]|uniref:Uncharacterized protein n=1 Tax=Trichonephila clavipes TaxID=2585209 RepID=A0A8X6RI12_TRICX|nr:hypothetical protein TNCV_914791 [Trichonephila clavipes]